MSKKGSKRQSTKLRVKVEKKVKNHARKLKRDKKKNPGKFATKSKKDPGVPNDCPFKDTVLAEAQEAIEKRNADKEKRRLELKELRKTGRTKKMSELRGQTLASLAATAARRGKVHEGAQGVVARVKGEGCTDRSAKAYYREFRKVVTAADVVLEVLDARDPLGSRCREVEQAVVADQGKRLVLVLNKADLVPRENLVAWVAHLRHEYPTVAFKASTQIGGRIGQAKIDMKALEGDISTRKCVGADTLMSLLANYCRNKDVKTSIRVGVVGLPNVGKSSLINSLKRARACPTGATPGVTKAMQEVQLDSKVKLLDCPGMVLASGSMTDASVALRNAMSPGSLADPITPVVAIMGRVPRQHLMLQYSIGHFADCSEFLALLAISLGKLRKGGVPDRDMAARAVLQDWTSGRIKYCTHPPVAEAREASAIVGQFAQEFSLDSLEKGERMDLQNLPMVRPSEMVDVEAGAIHDKAAEVEEEMEEMEAENDENVLPANIEVFARKGKRQERKMEEKKEKVDPLFKIEGNQRLEKMAKVVAKKGRKDRRRAERVGETLSNQMEDAFSKI